MKEINTKELIELLNSSTERTEQIEENYNVLMNTHNMLNNPDRFCSVISYAIAEYDSNENISFKSALLLGIRNLIN